MLPTKSKQDPKVLFNLACDVGALIVATIEAVMMVVVMVMMVVIIPPISRHHHDRGIVVITIAGIEGVVMMMVVMVMIVELGELNVGVSLRRRGFIDRLQQSPCVRDRLEQLGI